MSDPPANASSAPATLGAAEPVPEPVEPSPMSAATYPSLATDGNGRVVSAVGGRSPPGRAAPQGVKPPLGVPENSPPRPPRLMPRRRRPNRRR